VILAWVESQKIAS